jgi:hypothetical protein
MLTTRPPKVTASLWPINEPQPNFYTPSRLARAVLNEFLLKSDDLTFIQLENMDCFSQYQVYCRYMYSTAILNQQGSEINAQYTGIISDQRENPLCNTKNAVLILIPCMIEYVEIDQQMHWVVHFFIYTMAPTCFGLAMPS